MARRARKGVEPTQIVIIAAIVLAVAAVVAFMVTRSSDKFAALTPLPVGEYMANANSLSGSVFKVSGVVSGKERYTENNGQVIALEVDHGGEKLDLPVYVPVEFYSYNLNRGDAITTKVEVRGGGMLSIQDIQQ